jgi:phosphatidate cytidylyltransferase
MSTKRVQTGICLLGVAIALILKAPSGLFMGILTLLTGMCAFEWRYLLQPSISKYRRLLYSALTLLIISWIMAMARAHRFDLHWFQVMAVGLPCLAFIECLLPTPPLGKRSLFLGYMIGWLLFINFFWSIQLFDSMPFGRERLLASLSIMWLADMGAYWVGTKRGRHKLAPRISPGKSWEGVLGAFGLPFIGLMLAYALGWQGAGITQWWLIILVLVPVGIVGDLYESVYKRASKLKDSGTLLPGHGGILDRLDALLLTLPVSTLFL